VLGIVLTQVQDLARGLVDLHEFHTGPPLKLVRAVKISYGLEDAPCCMRREGRNAIIKKVG